MSGSGLPGNLRLGSSSWSTVDWVGPFYPTGSKPADFLVHYAEHFDTVEVDSTFYAIPSARMVDGWRAKTPEGFTLAAKIPRIITHDKQLEGCEEEMKAFLGVMSRLESRLGPLLFQFSYFPKRKDPDEYRTGEAFRSRLERFLDGLPDGFRFAVEVRNETWLTPPLLDLLRTRNVALALVAYYTMPPIGRLLQKVDPVTADFLYVRFLGDHRRMDKIVEERSSRTGSGKKWHALAVDRTRDMAAWVPALRELCPRVDVAYVFVNNHYAGYAPGSIDLLRSLFEGTRP
jgi:uncharacterized protein YecE (DUF72 family)